MTGSVFAQRYCSIKKAHLSATFGGRLAGFYVLFGIIIMAEKEELARRLSAAVSRAISEALSQVEVRRHRVKADYLGFLSRSFKLSCPF